MNISKFFIIACGVAFFTSCSSLSQYTYSNRVAKRNQKLLAENGGNASNYTPDSKNSTAKTKKGVEDKIPAGKKLSSLEYIEMYSPYAIESMHKKKVPASITLAQGLLESGNGNSKLSRATNNHFGIKCGGTWNGESYRYDDDRPQECFRVYSSVLESYEDHGDFLRTRSWYASLFDLRITDYKGWAKGLKKAGYATDPQYPNKLISIIEKYRLHEYDKK